MLAVKTLPPKKRRHSSTKSRHLQRWSPGRKRRRSLVSVSVAGHQFLAARVGMSVRVSSAYVDGISVLYPDSSDDVHCLFFSINRPLLCSYLQKHGVKPTLSKKKIKVYAIREGGELESCWTAQVLDAFQGLRHCDSFVQAVQRGFPISTQEFVLMTSGTVCGQWRDVEGVSSRDT
eukprot:1158749-Pelagomonas_calceolata.AAC.1